MTAPGATELSDAARATDNVAGDCPRLLVVTDVFLDSNDPGAIFLRTLLEMYPRERLATCHLSPREASLPASLAGVRNITVRRPREHGIGRLGKTFQVLSRGPMELWVRNVLAPGVARRVADFGRRHGAELLLFVLNGPTTLSTARPVADELGVPLLDA